MILNNIQEVFRRSNILDNAGDTVKPAMIDPVLFFLWDLLLGK